jgi:hypothetical protein
MRETLVDPRDQEWEIERPAYRVYFVHKIEGVLRKTEEWELTELDLREALSWAEQRAVGREYEFYVVVTGQQPQGLGMVRLL